MVRTLLAILLLALHLPAAAQAPAWQSARAIAAVTSAGGGLSLVSATAVDAVGNVYLAGRFTNTVALGTTTLTSLGNTDVFVAKFNPAINQFVWAQRAGSPGYEGATALAVSGTSVYVAGYFNSPTADFGATTLTSTGTVDMFVAKLTDAGSTSSFAWAQRAGGSGRDYATALAVSGTSVYVAGYFNSPTAGFGLATLANAGDDDVFVAKLTDAGGTSSFAWAQRAGGTGNDQATALAVSGNNVYMAGYFDGPTASFGTAMLANAGITGYFDSFVAKLTDAGSFVWTQQAGGTVNDFANALAVSGTSVYVAGHFNSPTAGFGPVTLTTSGSTDVFVAKLTDAGSTGHFMWAQRAGDSGYEQGTALAVSGTSVYVAGSFSGFTASFGPTTLTGVGGDDVFVAKLTDAGLTGSFAWAQWAGGTGGDVAYSLAISGTSVCVVGYFDSPTVAFGPTTLTNPNPSPNTSLSFLASLTGPTLTATTAPAGPREPVQFFPNPAHGTATLRLPAGTAPAPLTLTDALGRAVRRYPTPAGSEAVLDLQGLPAGLYLLRGAGPAQRLAIE
ncbi:hypothetical protein GCM10028822_15240 [Hymenobacter terrigena]